MGRVGLASYGTRVLIASPVLGALVGNTLAFVFVGVDWWVAIIWLGIGFVMSLAFLGAFYLTHGRGG